MAARSMFTVAGYELAADRRYDPEANLWVAELAPGRVRVGLDPLGAETAGDIVAVSFPPLGARVARGEPLATIEAAKFVGPIVSPLGGVLAATGEQALTSPSTINADPLGAWLVELERVDARELQGLIAGVEAVTAWFAQAVERFRSQGAIAQ